MANKKATYCGAMSNSAKPGSTLKRQCGGKHPELGIYQCSKCAAADHRERVRLNAARYEFMRAAASRPVLEQIVERCFSVVPKLSPTPDDFDNLFDKAMAIAIDKGLKW